MSDSLDPQLPYIQVHRSSAAKAAMLCGSTGLPIQHIRGGLLMLWESLSDRRLLVGDAVTLDEASCRRLIRGAFGVDIEPLDLASAGFLEPINGMFRVRGMSRQLKTERARASKANKTSFGAKSVVPGSGVVSRAYPGSIPAPSREHPGSIPAPSREPHGSQATEERGERRELKAFKAEGLCESRDSKAESLNSSPPQQRMRKKRACEDEEKPSAEFRTASDALVADFAKLTGARYGWQGAKDGAALARILAFETDVLEIRRRWRIGLSAPVSAWASCRTVAQLAAKWNDLAKRDVAVGTVASDDWELIVEQHNKQPPTEEEHF